jgi:lipoprotein signal peptidase
MGFGIAKTGIFNLADLSVTTGMILILLSTFKEKVKPEEY